MVFLSVSSFAAVVAEVAAVALEGDVVKVSGNYTGDVGRRFERAACC